MSDLILGAIQLTSTEDVPANVERCRRLVRGAAAAGATLIGLPENFAYLGGDADHRLWIAEELARPAGPILAAMQELAREVHTWLLLGGFPERGTAGRLIRNSSVLLDPAGEIAATYRKIHLFDVDV